VLPWLSCLALVAGGVMSKSLVVVKQQVERNIGGVVVSL
jgi:hypothetical protein